MVLIPARARLMHEYVTAGASFSTSTTAHELTCGAGKRIAILHGFVDPDNSATVNIWLMRGAAFMQRIVNIGAGTAHVSWPHHTDSTVFIGGQVYPVIMDAGDTLEFTYGAAQGAGTILSVNYMEWSV